jgi:heparan-alpha-glucosaminide N-acetyltransferase
MQTLLTETPTYEKPAPPAPPPTITLPRPLEKPARLTSLDAYRGFIMLAMASGGFTLAKVAEHFPGNRYWDFVGYHTDHVAWVGCGFWDLIQPSFMFMAGVAIPYSYASRKNKGESDALILFHVAVRSLVLVLLGIFLSSNGGARPEHLLVNVLTQIGLGYFFVTLLRGRGLIVQLAATAIVLVGYWLWFVLYPLPPAGFDYQSVGLKDGPYLSGFFAHWEMNTNAAAYFDRWLLNLLPAYRDKPFVFNPGGYQTLNFIPSMATMLFGLMAGELLRGRKSGRVKLAWLVAAGLICLALGLLAGWTLCPIVKRIWTPSWAVYSAGWTFWMLAAFYAICDLNGWKSWAFFLTVVGMNSIAIYCMSQMLKPAIRGTFHNLVGEWWILRWIDPIYLPVVQYCVVLTVLWLACYWMYRRGIFVRI